MLETVPREARLAYLAGAYWRFGCGSSAGAIARSCCRSPNSFVLFNAKHKAEVIAGLLMELGCEGVRVESTQGLIPQTNSVYFKPTEEVAGWLQWEHP